MEIFDPLARDFQGQEMIENGRRTVKFFCCTKLDKPTVNKVLFALKDIGNEIQIKPSLASKLRNIETNKVMLLYKFKAKAQKIACMTNKKEIRGWLGQEENDDPKNHRKA